MAYIFSISSTEYCPEATIEFEIKKWVGAKYSDVVTIYDQEGNRQRNIQKRSIVKAYIKYIIDQAEDFFGVKFSKLHFTAPVKLKTSFIKFMERLLEGEYQVLSSKESVDEAVAVIFDYISKKKISKQVRCIETGIVYCSQTEAAKEAGIKIACISQVCNGKYKTAGGYHWEFVEEPA